MALCRPHNTTEICVKSNLLPATITVHAPPTHDQESVGTKIVALISLASISIWCCLWCIVMDKFGHHLSGYGGIIACDRVFCSNVIRWKTILQPYWCCDGAVDFIELLHWNIAHWNEFNTNVSWLSSNFINLFRHNNDLHSTVANNSQVCSSRSIAHSEALPTMR